VGCGLVASSDRREEELAARAAGFRGGVFRGAVTKGPDRAYVTVAQNIEEGEGNFQVLLLFFLMI
jgi:hypothetical protein